MRVEKFECLGIPQQQSESLNLGTSDPPLTNLPSSLIDPVDPYFSYHNYRLKNWLNKITRC
jgi:hypothetical protein